MNYSSVCKEETDIFHAMSLSVWQRVNVANEFEAWVSFLQRVSLFCNKHGIQVHGILHNYLTYGRSARLLRTKQMIITSREKYIWLSMIKLVKSLIYSRFDKVNMKFLFLYGCFGCSWFLCLFWHRQGTKTCWILPPTIFQALTWLATWNLYWSHEKRWNVQRPKQLIVGLSENLLMRQREIKFIIFYQISICLYLWLPQVLKEYFLQWPLDKPLIRMVS
jgi:hypothetical protein